MSGGFNYRQSISVTGIPGTEYQVPFILHSGNGNSAGRDIYLNGYSTTFPYDIGFGSTSDTPLDFWVQSSSITGTTAKVWVNFPASSTGGYIYAGSTTNINTKTDGDGFDTFPFFEKFGDPVNYPVYTELNNSWENWNIQPVQFINGSIFAIWEHSTEEVSNGGVIYGAYSHDGGYTWTQPITYADTPNRRDAEGYFLLDGNTLYGVYASFDNINIPYPSTIWFKKSYDNAETFTNPVSIGSSSMQIVPTSRILKLEIGNYQNRLIFPAYEIITVGGQVSSCTFNSDDNGETWYKSNGLTSLTHQFCEPTIVECSDGHLSMLLRDSTNGLWFWYSHSTDGGTTWSTPSQSTIRDSKTRGHLLKLSDGTITLLHNDVSNDDSRDPGEPVHFRYPFSISILDSATASTKLYTRDIISSDQEYSSGVHRLTGNPGLCELNNGNILITASNENNLKDVFAMVISPGDLKIGLKNQWTPTATPIYYSIGYGSTAYLDISDNGYAHSGITTGSNTFGEGYAFQERSKTYSLTGNSGRAAMGFGEYIGASPYGNFFGMVINSMSTSTMVLASEKSTGSFGWGTAVTDNAASYYTDEYRRVPNNYTWFTYGLSDANAQYAQKITTNLPTGAYNIRLSGTNENDHASKARSLIDYALVRQVIATEPTPTTYGSWEQTQINPEGNYIVSFTSDPTTPALGETVNFTLSIGTTPEVITRLYYSKSDLYSPTFALESNFRLVGGTWYEYNATNPTGTAVSNYRPYHYTSSFNSAGTKAMRVEIQSASGLTYDTSTLTYTINPNAPGSIPVYVDVIYGNSTAHTLMAGSELNVTNNNTGVTSGWFVLPTGHYRGSISRGDTYNLSAKWLNWTIQSVSVTPGTTEEYIEVTIPLFPPNPTNATILWNFYGYDNQGVLQPLSDVKISYGYDDSLNMSGFPIYSNSQGIASWGAGIPTQTYTFTYSKSGYKSQTDTTVLLTNGMTKTVILEKQALFKILVAINMLDIAGNIIGTVPYALVNVSDSEDNVITSFSTNSDGSGYATVSPGMYKLSSSKAGYTPDYKIVTVNDWDIYAELNMVKQGATPLPTATPRPTVTATPWPSTMPTDEHGGFGGQGGFAWLIYNFLHAFGFGGYEIPLVLSALVIGILFCIGAMTRSMPVAILGAVMGFALSTFWGWIPWYVFIVFALVVGIAVWKLWDR